MSYDENEVFETFENEFNRKENKKRPGNRFPWWVIPVVLIGCAAVYFGTRRQDIRTPEETSAVPIASDAAPFGELDADGTESASEATVTSVPATALPSFFDRFTALRAAHPTATPQPAADETEAAPADGTESAGTRPLLPTQLEFAGDPAVPTNAPVNANPNPLNGTARPVSIANPTVALPSETLPSEPFPSEPVPDEATDAPERIDAAKADGAAHPVPTATEEPGFFGRIAAFFSGNKTVNGTLDETDPDEIPSEEPAGQTAQAAAEFSAPTGSLAESPSATQAEDPTTAAAPLIDAAHTDFPTAASDPFMTSGEPDVPALQPTETDTPGFFESIRIFFAGPPATQTPSVSVPTSANGNGIPLAENAFPDGLPVSPTAEPNGGFFASIANFFFPPTETPLPTRTPEAVLPLPSQGEADAKNAAPTAKSDLDDEPMYAENGEEPFYLVTSEIPNPPTLIPAGNQPIQPAPPLSVTATQSIGLPIVTQAVPTRPILPLPFNRATATTALAQIPTQRPLQAATATFEAPLIGDSEDDPGLPDHQAHLIPTALPNTGIGDDFQLWRMGALLLLLFLIMIAARTRRQRK